VLAASEDTSVVPGLIAGAGLAAVAWLVPGVRAGVVTVGGVTFALFLAPVLAAPGTLLLDNRLYLPACGVIVVLAELARASVAAARVEARLVAALSGATLVALAALTMAFERSFHDRRAFAREAVAGSPHSALAHFCLGQSFQIDGDEARALAEYEASLALGPAEVVHNNIAVIHMSNGRWPQAERELREELAIDPRYARAYSNLAVVLRHEGRLDESRLAEERALALYGSTPQLAGAPVEPTTSSPALQSSSGP
jgi:tetratricopeptide (TPR) repeat protein